LVKVALEVLLRSRFAAPLEFPGLSWRWAHTVPVKFDEDGFRFRLVVVSPYAARRVWAASLCGDPRAISRRPNVCRFRPRIPSDRYRS